jgi:uncharacterized protein YggE
MHTKPLVAIHMVGLVSLSLAQVGGGSVYNQAQGMSPRAAEQAMRSVAKDDLPPAGSIYLDASVMINVRADEYVAVFGISQEGSTLQETSNKVGATIGEFINSIKQLGVRAADIDIDYVAQNRTYGYEVNGDIAQEKLVGFEFKKNVAVHYRDKAMLDKLLLSASKAGIFDLIKVDYIVKDISTVHTKLMEDAAKVLRLKASNHSRLLGIKLRQPPQVVAERYGSYYPSEMYDSYAAFESEDVSGNYYRSKFTVQGARKVRTFYYNALNGKGYDDVVNPVVVEPMVQFTLFLKARFTSDDRISTSKRTPSHH